MHASCLMLTCNAGRLHIQINNQAVLLESVNKTDSSCIELLPLGMYANVCSQADTRANCNEVRNPTLLGGQGSEILQSWYSSAQPEKLG